MMNINKTFLGTLIFSAAIHLFILFCSFPGLQKICSGKGEEKLIVSFDALELPAVLAKEPLTKKKEIGVSKEISNQRYKLEELLEEEEFSEEQNGEIKLQDNADMLIAETLPEEKIENADKLAKCNTDSQSDSFPFNNQNSGVSTFAIGQIEDIKNKFLKEVVARIQKAKIYPESARINGIEGTAKIAFSIASKGKLLSVKIKTSSGSTILDRAAVSIIERAAPFPPIPKELGISNIELIVPLVFKLEDEAR